MGLGFQGDDALHVFDAEEIGTGVVFGRKLLDDGAFGEGYVVLIGRDNFSRMLAGRLFNHLEEAARLLFSVDDEGASENLVAAMLGVNLREAEDLAVCELAAHVFLDGLEVFYFFLGEGEAFLLVVFLQVLDFPDGLCLESGSEDGLRESVVHALEHLVVLGRPGGYGKIFFDAADAGKSHVLGDFHGIRAPRSNHFLARAYEEAAEVCLVFGRCSAEEPAEAGRFVSRGGVVHLHGYDVLERGSEK